ncbi:MAG: hypothetical protein LC687_06645 [Actinobacteria bacterium]|nr:hypothetical protein [Actinomycetota bacterium]
MDKVAKRVVGDYFLWQIEAYGQDYLDGSKPADLYRVRVMPSTPQGDYVATVKDARTGDQLLDEIADNDCDEYDPSKDHFEPYGPSY